jgi:thiamine biosynthesis lipoprotein
MDKIFIIIAIVVVSISCNHFAPENYYSCEGNTQGTFFHITYQYDSELCVEMDSLLNQFSQSLSNYNSESLISRVNTNQTTETDAYFLRMFEAATEVNQNTQGAFDITIAPVANELGFGWEHHEPITEIDTAYILDLLQNVGMDKLWIDDGVVVKSNPNVQIIGNAIAQGLSVDVVSEFLKEHSITNFLVEIGGELYASGLSPDLDPWEIGVDKPIKGSGYENRETQIILNFSDWAVATSGNYRKFLELGSQSLGHSIDPRTGFPAKNNLLSVTVLAKTCVLADAYATAFMVLGLEESMDLVEKTDAMEAYFIYLDQSGSIETTSTSGFDAFISY